MKLSVRSSGRTNGLRATDRKSDRKWGRKSGHRAGSKAGSRTGSQDVGQEVRMDRRTNMLMKTADWSFKQTLNWFNSSRKWRSLTETPPHWPWWSVIDELLISPHSDRLKHKHLISVSTCFYFEEQEVVSGCGGGQTDRSGLPVGADALSIILRPSVDSSETSAAERAHWMCNMTPTVSHLRPRLLLVGVACHGDASRCVQVLVVNLSKACVEWMCWSICFIIRSMIKQPTWWTNKKRSDKTSIINNLSIQPSVIKRCKISRLTLNVLFLELVFIKSISSVCD